MTKIEWVARPGTIPESWNLIGGCNFVSEGCYNCWAARMAATRLKDHPRYTGLTTRRTDGSYRWTGEIRLDETELQRPSGWKKPRTVFVNSMSDLFHYEVPGTFIKRSVWNVMVDYQQHTFLLLTKRPARALELLQNHTPWPENIWVGVSVENQDYTFRIEHLRQTDAQIKFLSLEPLLGPLPDLNLRGMDWVIVGGESGPNARPMHPQWARDIKSQCQAAGIPFFHKQNGEFIEVTSDFKGSDLVLMHDGKPLGRYDVWADRVVEKRYTVLRRVGKKAAGYLLDGEKWHQWPA